MGEFQSSERLCLKNARYMELVAEIHEHTSEELHRRLDSGPCGYMHTCIQPYLHTHKNKNNSWRERERARGREREE